MNKIQIDGEHLTLAELYAVVFDGAEVELAPVGAPKDERIACGD